MEYIVVTESELLDILDVCSEQDLEAYYSHEADGIHVYADALDTVEDILWASEVCEWAGVSHAISAQKEWISG